MIAPFHGTDIEHKNVLAPTICNGNLFSTGFLVVVAFTKLPRNIPNTPLDSYPLAPFPGIS